jgi:hypothetical protein
MTTPRTHRVFVYGTLKRGYWAARHRRISRPGAHDPNLPDDQPVIPGNLR